jgi:uncharacterized protein (TIGR00299 family) protein
MSVLYLDCQAGISGDMTVAALLDLGISLEYLKTELGKLELPEDSYHLSISCSERQHISAMKFDVMVHTQNVQRCYAEIDRMITESELSDAVKNKASRIFRRLAEAEAKVHGVAIEQVHFHEVGAVDSIIDIVGTAICLDYLQVEQIFASALPLGNGFVDTAHGRLPVPAPATAVLMKGMPVHNMCGPGERVTPTGAAILAALASGFGQQPVMQLVNIGCGAGNKVFEDCPNVLRAFLGEIIEKNETKEEVIVAESNIDDSTPEVLGYAMERLFEQGALDVYFTPIQMKKNRPGVIMSFLCRPPQLQKLSRLLLQETSAIGLRYFTANRIILERCTVERRTEFGMIRFKQVIDDSGKMYRDSPEYEDCRRVARETGIPCREIFERLQQKGIPEA